MKNTFINEYETKKALSEFILKTDRFSMGLKCSEFEDKFSEFQQSDFSILFNSGGSANLALLQALKNLGYLKNGDRVGFSALTWSTNVMPIIQLGMIPVPVDCMPETLNVMSDTLLNRLKDIGLQAVFITNALGFAGDIDRIQQICSDKNIILIEDNCESLGTELCGKKTGHFGLAATFSFFVAHHMSTIEGGMVCTDNADLSEMLRIVRANGWDRNLTAVQQAKWRKKYCIDSEFQAKYSFYDLGYNFRPTEITGFLGLEQLKYIETNLNRRQEIYLALEKNIHANSDLITLKRDHISFLSPFAFPVISRSVELKQRYLSQFSGAGIEIRPIISGNMQEQPFYKKYCQQEFKLDGTDIIHNQGFYCGIYPDLNKNDIEIIISCLQKW